MLSPLEDQLRESIEWSLSNFMTSNAVFLAERLNSEPSASQSSKDQKLQLLSRCYLQENSPQKVVLLLKSSLSEETVYLYALASFQTGKLEEAERALQRFPLHSSESYFLLGQICEKQCRVPEAINYFTRALNSNKNLWSAYEKLCKLGANPDPRQAFSASLPLAPLTGSNYGNWTLQSQGKVKIDDLSELLMTLARPFLLLSQYNVDEALATFKSLPEPQGNSAWANCQIGRCFFEKYDFASAIEFFGKAFAQEPQRIEDSDFYSSCLWYEKKHSELLHVVHNCLKNFYYSPQTWVVAGNFYSLQKERETAIKLFNRAIQLNPYYTYAYSLCGHEYLANEDFDQAKSNYEAARNIDPRQYTALWGLGSMYFKQEKFTQSLQCYKEARVVNPNSSILMTYLGVNYKSLNNFPEAINSFEAAIKLDKKNPLPKFQLGILLSYMNRDKEALKYLEGLCQENSKESHLYIQIGKIYAKIGQAEKALKCYNDAQELNPKNHNEIKNLIEQLHGTSSYMFP
jgi:anaphase-promoting complex subunit 3